MKTWVLCVLCILFSTPSLLIRRRNGPPLAHCISDGTFAHPDVDVCLFYFLEVFVNIEENWFIFVSWLIMVTLGFSTWRFALKKRCHLLELLRLFWFDIWPKNTINKKNNCIPKKIVIGLQIPPSRVSFWWHESFHCKCYKAIQNETDPFADLHAAFYMN